MEPPLLTISAVSTELIDCTFDPVKLYDEMITGTWWLNFLSDVMPPVALECRMLPLTVFWRIVVFRGRGLAFT